MSDIDENSDKMSCVSEDRFLKKKAKHIWHTMGSVNNVNTHSYVMTLMYFGFFVCFFIFSDVLFLLKWKNYIYMHK